jgi:hypothetical protein
MAIKGGCVVDTMSMNDDGTSWNLEMTVSTLADNGAPRRGNTDLLVPAANNDSQVRSAVMAHAKTFITANWGITFGGADTVQLWICTRVEG